MKLEKFVRITPSSVILDGKRVEVKEHGRQLLNEVYHILDLEYPKYFKMDILCKLGFVASELIHKDDSVRFIPRSDRAVLMYSRNGCLDNDRNYQKTISDDNYFPSPSLFVYTLPNIITGEICIRNKYLGDSTAFVLPNFDAGMIVDSVRTAFADTQMSSALCGWVDCRTEDDFDALLMLVSSGVDGNILNDNILKKIFEYGKID